MLRQQRRQLQHPHPGAPEDVVEQGALARVRRHEDEPAGGGRRQVQDLLDVVGRGVRVGGPDDDAAPDLGAGGGGAEGRQHPADVVLGPGGHEREAVGAADRLDEPPPPAARRPPDNDRLRRAARLGGEGVGQPGPLAGPVEHRPCRPGRGRGTQHLQVCRPGLRGRVHAELVGEDPPAPLVLGEGAGDLPHPGVGEHEHPAGPLLGGVDLEQARGEVDSVTPPGKLESGLGGVTQDARVQRPQGHRLLRHRGRRARADADVTEVERVRLEGGGVRLGVPGAPAVPVGLLGEAHEGRDVHPAALRRRASP